MRTLSLDLQGRMPVTITMCHESFWIGCFTFELKFLVLHSWFWHVNGIQAQKEHHPCDLRTAWNTRRWKFGISKSSNYDFAQTWYQYQVHNCSMSVFREQAFSLQRAFFFPFRHCALIGFYTSSKSVRRAIALEMVARVVKIELRSRWRDIVVIVSAKMWYCLAWRRFATTMLLDRPHLFPHYF